MERWLHNRCPSLDGDFQYKIYEKSAHSSCKIYAQNNRWAILIYGTEWGVAKFQKPWGIFR